MTELQLIESEWTQGNESQKLLKRRRTKRIKIITRVNSRAPVCSACELPILSLLSKTPETGLQARIVLQVVSQEWFNDLNENDQKARYQLSKKKIVQTVIKFARKNLVIKGEVFPSGEGVCLSVGGGISLNNADMFAGGGVLQVAGNRIIPEGRPRAGMGGGIYSCSSDSTEDGAHP